MSDKSEVARRLAESHYRTDATIVQIIRLSTGDEAEQSPDEPVKLLEVNEATVESGILPLGFNAHPESGIDYPCVIVEVTPREFEEINKGNLRLPNGWQMGESLPRPSATEGGGR
jgi:hypothetical protein